MSGTSMAAPHVAGLAALLRQKYPDRSPEFVKAAIMNNALPLINLALTDQGAGRIRAVNSMNAKVVATEPSVSFGRVAAGSDPSRTITLSCTCEESISVNLATATTRNGSSVTGPAAPASVTIPAGGNATFQLSLDTGPDDAEGTYEGRITATFTGGTITVPYMYRLFKAPEISIEGAPIERSIIHVGWSYDTVEVANNGSGDLKYRLEGRAEGWRQGGLKVLANDPAGDYTGAPVDILRVDGIAADGYLTMRLTFATSTPVQEIAAAMYLDIDQDFRTGTPKGDIGWEYLLYFDGAAEESVFYDQTMEGLVIPLILEGNTAIADWELEYIGNDDGAMHFIVEAGPAGTTTVLDTAPDTLFGVLDAGPGIAPWMCFHPSSGTLGPGESQTVNVFTRCNTKVATTTHEALITDISNDHEAGTQSLPFTLIVTQAPSVPSASAWALAIITASLAAAVYVKRRR